MGSAQPEGRRQRTKMGHAQAETSHNPIRLNRIRRASPRPLALAVRTSKSTVPATLQSTAARKTNDRTR
jgi:hypothetical protein